MKRSHNSNRKIVLMMINRPNFQIVQLLFPALLVLVSAKGSGHSRTSEPPQWDRRRGGKFFLFCFFVGSFLFGEELTDNFQMHMIRVIKFRIKDRG